MTKKEKESLLGQASVKISEAMRIIERMQRQCNSSKEEKEELIWIYQAINSASFHIAMTRMKYWEAPPLANQNLWDMNKIKVLIFTDGSTKTFKIGDYEIAEVWRNDHPIWGPTGIWQYRVTPMCKMELTDRGQDTAIGDVKHIIQYQLNLWGIDVEFVEGK